MTDETVAKIIILTLWRTGGDHQVPSYDVDEDYPAGSEIQ